MNFRPERIEACQELLEQGRPAQALKLLPKGLPAGFAAEVAHLRAEALRAMGDLGGCRRWYETSLARTEPAADLALWLDSCLGLVAALRSLGLCAQARRRLAEGLALAAGRRPSMASHLERLRLEEVLLDRAEGLYGKSIRGLKAFQRTFRRRRDWAGEGFVLWALGGARRFSGDLAGSTEDFLRSRSRFRKAGDGIGEGYALLGLGGVERIRGNLAEASRRYLAARRVFAKTQDLFARAYAECGLGNCLRQRGLLSQAKMRYRKAHALYSRISDPADLAYVDWGLGKIALQEGDLREAGRRLSLALSGFERFGEARGVVLSLTALAACLHAQGRTREAESIFDRGLRLARRSGLHAHLEVFT
ncbi:MAG: tetratricopeptide repeat protein [Elusimicrobia bacterium]|nr:tetratricopeptide repeat protein [Elusimicrobiota bacterium]